MELYSQNFSFEAILRNCILKTFLFEATLRSCIPILPFEAILQNCILKTFFFEVTLRSCILILPFEAIQLNCILKTFPLRQLCGVVFSKHFLWGNSTKLYSQNLPLWGNSAELYSHTFSFGTTLKSCIPTNVWGHYISTWIN